VVHCGATWFKSQAMNINAIGANMAIQEVILTTSDNVQFSFNFHLSGRFFTASLVSASGRCDSLTVISDTARIHSSSSSRFEIFFQSAMFDFPHAELEKFKAFLDEVETARQSAEYFKALMEGSY
jgi:hypothetical protein